MGHVNKAKLIYEVRYMSKDGKPGYLTAKSTREEAEAEAERMNKRSAEMGLGAVYAVRELDVTGCFEFPLQPSPRERYHHTWKQKPSRPGCWDLADVEIREGGEELTVSGLMNWKEGGRLAASYERDYPGTPPFEPFRQSGKDYALISRHYQAADVVDLATGDVIASEDREAKDWGFCPAGFYVPDWWDVHDGSILPGSKFWEDHDEWPDGTLGFVWGCHWGDDNGWKVQALDLSQITKGKLGRDERFGYLYLDTHNKLAPSEFIRCWAGKGSQGPSVTFSVPRRFDLMTGHALEEG
jgi:hypothetical protein